MSWDMGARQSPGTAGSWRCCHSRRNNRSCRRRVPPAGQAVAEHEATGRRVRRSDSLVKRRDHGKTAAVPSAAWSQSIVLRSEGKTSVHGEEKMSHIIMFTARSCWFFTINFNFILFFYSLFYIAAIFKHIVNQNELATTWLFFLY